MLVPVRRSGVAGRCLEVKAVGAERSLAVKVERPGASGVHAMAWSVSVGRGVPYGTVGRGVPYGTVVGRLTAVRGG